MYLILVTFDKMTDITTYPLEDWFETELSQARDGAVWTIYVNDTPSFTFPAWVTTYIIVDPWKTTMQLAKISAYSSSLKTITVSSISVNKWASIAYTQQSHQIGAKVRISHNYQFWKDMIDGINSKMNTNSDDLEVWKFADATARDAYRPTPVNWYSAYLIDVWYWTDYQSGNRVQRASWGSFSNATESISWGTEIWTTAEVTAWTAIWWTWASLSVTPAKLAAQIQSWSYISLASATDSWTDTYVTTATPTLTAYTTGALFVVTFAETNTTTTPTLNIDWLWAVTITDKDSVALAVWDITTNKLILMKVWSAIKIMTLDSTTKKEVIKAAWENITAGNALRLWLWNYSGDTLTQNSTNWNQVDIWYSIANYASWQSMTLSNWWILTSIKFRLRKIWSPSWLLKVSVYDNSWPTLLFWSSNSINETTLTWSDAEYTFNFNNFLPEWTYRFFVWADRAVNTTNYTTAPLHWTITLWTRYVVSSAIDWTPTRWSHRFSVTVSSMNEPTTELFKAKALLRYNNFIWFAKNTATTWNNVTIDQTYNNKQTGLTRDTTYYLSDTAWTIGTSAWTISRVVWRSISTTELLINLFW